MEKEFDTKSFKSAVDSIISSAKAYGEQDPENRKDVLKNVDMLLSFKSSNSEVAKDIQEKSEPQEKSIEEESIEEEINTSSSESVNFLPVNNQDLEFFQISESRLKEDIKNVIFDSSNIFAQDKWWEDEKLLKDVVEDLSTALLG